MIASIIYRAGHTGAVIAFYGDCCKLNGQRYCFFSASLFRYHVPAFHFFNS
jgi:hypothetical protein